MSKDLTAVEIYQRLAPGRALPVALVAAQARLDESRLNRAVRAPRRDIPTSVLDEGSPDEALTHAIASRPGELRQAAVDDSRCPAAGFSASSCGNSGSYANICRRQKTGENAIRKENTRLLGWRDWMIADRLAFIDQDIESRITNADGDGFHHAASFWD